MSHAPTANEEEAAVLQRMAASRTALLAARYAAPPARSTSRHPNSVKVGDLIVRAPRVTLLLALCASAIILGPRRTLAVAGSTGALAWLGLSGRPMLSKLM
ncbi:hypothetical protein [Paraburkholderia sp.]|jgi:hypothetical protein|uniref:hypothetical protein n=1 Tax=Paraburkholderia sp. TaxID=1926495 RepID=UPI002F417544